jgi:hypothetical protein
VHFGTDSMAQTIGDGIATKRHMRTQNQKPFWAFCAFLWLCSRWGLGLPTKICRYSEFLVSSRHDPERRAIRCAILPAGGKRPALPFPDDSTDLASGAQMVDGLDGSAAGAGGCSGRDRLSDSAARQWNSRSRCSRRQLGSAAFTGEPDGRGAYRGGAASRGLRSGFARFSPSLFRIMSRHSSMTNPLKRISLFTNLRSFMIICIGRGRRPLSGRSCCWKH